MTPLEAAKFLDGRVTEMTVTPDGQLMGARYREGVTWGDRTSEMLDVIIARDRMPPEDVEACGR